jgi:hypothetical protein
MRKYVPYLIGFFLASLIFFYDVVNERTVTVWAIILRYGTAFIGSFLLSKYYLYAEKNKHFWDTIHYDISIKNRVKIWAKCSFFWGCFYFGLGFGTMFIVGLIYTAIPN